MSKIFVQECLNSVSQFCSTYSKFINIQTVDFIVGRMWDILPLELSNELLNLQENQIESLLCSDFTEPLIKDSCPQLYHFIEGTKKHSLNVLSDSLHSNLSDCVTKAKGPGSIPKEIQMTPKKSHEVEAMASVIGTLAQQTDIHTVVDFGTGKGYLSTRLALHHNLSVLGVDSKERNCIAASMRNVKLASQFNNKKAKLKKSSTSENDSIEYSHAKDGTFIGQVLTVKDDTSLDCIIQDFMKAAGDSRRSSKVLFSALHACGNLQPCMLKHFLATRQAKVLCSVGCCYQHVQERFSPNPFPLDVNDEIPDYGFPLSEALKKQDYTIGYNARMLANQSMSRITHNKSVQYKPLFYRALLQVILKDHCSLTDLKALRVGKLATKCSSFHDYVYKALKKLELDHIKLSEDDLNEYLDKYREEEKKLHAVQFLRVLLAPCIETLLLLDRLAFLLDHDEVQEASIVGLFDPIISPRCYALIAVKR